MSKVQVGHVQGPGWPCPSSKLAPYLGIFGALVARGALETALRNGRPGYAAVDVYENEPVLDGKHPLLGLDNALCTAHSAWLERDTYELYFGEAFANAAAFASGQPVRLVNTPIRR